MPQEDPPTTRTRVLDAAKSLLAHSRGPISMGALAEAAGVSRATLYREFKGRRELRRALGGSEADSARWAETSIRARILGGARRAIAEHGVFSVTIGHVAEAAGVGEASVYRTFGDREALLRAAFDELPVRQAALELLSDTAAPTRPTLIGLAKTLLSFAAAEPELLRLVAFGHESEARYVKELRSGQRSSMAQLARYLAAQQEMGRLRKCSPEQLVGGLLGATYAAGVALRREFGGAGSAPDEQVLEERAREVVDVFLQGAARRPGRRGDRE